jgi:hypothetical protein
MIDQNQSRFFRSGYVAEGPRVGVWARTYWKRESVRTLIVDDGEFQLAIKRRALDQLCFGIDPTTENATAWKRKRMSAFDPKRTSQALYSYSQLAQGVSGAY